MTPSDGVKAVADNLAERAQAILEEGYPQTAIIQSAMADFKALGSLSGIMAVASTGKLNTAQMERLQRIAVKALAIMGMHEAEKGA